MTIAAGFRFSDGILICADSEGTDGLTKSKISKVFPFVVANGRGPKTVFAGSGMDLHFRRLANTCEAEFQKIYRGDLRKIDGEDMQVCVAYAVAEFYRKHIFPNPRSGAKLYPLTEMIVAVWSPVTKKASMLVTMEDVVDEVNDVAFVGGGSGFARIVCGKLWHPGMSLNRVKQLAAHVLYQTKQHVTGCGNQSEYVVLDDSGRMTEKAYFDASLEDYSERIMDFISTAAFQITDPALNFEGAMRQFRAAAKQLRACSPYDGKKQNSGLSRLTRAGANEEPMNPAIPVTKKTMF